MTRKWRWHLAVCLAWMFMSSAGASPQWLLTQQQPDGSIATSAYLATSVQSTAEAVKTLRVLGVAESLGGPVGFLANQPYPGTEYLSRKVIASAEAALPTDVLIADLIAHQNPDGGRIRYVHPEAITLRAGVAAEHRADQPRGTRHRSRAAGLACGCHGYGGAAATQANGSLAWEYALDTAETIELPLWVRLPAQTGDIHAVIQTGVAPDYVEHNDATLTVRVALGS
jgi:hypothetical protein